MAATPTRLLSSNRAGWAMAAPAFGLILLINWYFFLAGRKESHRE